MSQRFARLCGAALLGLVELTAAARARAQAIVLPRVTEDPPAVAGTTSTGTSIPLLVTVTKDGSVENPTLVDPGDPGIDSAALSAVLLWKFAPATRDGVPVSARIRVLVPVVAAALSEPTPSPSPPQDVSAKAAPRAPDASKPPSGLPSASSAEASEPAPTEITVHGRRTPPSAGASDVRIELGELSHVPRGSATELLQLAPGIYLSKEGGEGHAERIYLRGFDAREGQDVELTVGGIPINESGNFHGSGFADTGFLIPELVHGLRVLEGPFDVRQGNYAVAGSADYETRVDRRGLTAKYTLGSYGTQRALALYAPGDDATYAAAELFKTDGYGQNRDLKRARSMAQYEGRLGEHGSYRVSGAAYGIEYHSAGVLRQDDVDAGRVGFFDTYDPRQGGSASRYHVSFDLEQQSGKLSYALQFFAIRRSVRFRENLTGFLLDTQEAFQSLHDQRGDLLDLQVDETTYGAKGYARTSLSAFGQKQDFELGYYARGDDTNNVRERIDAAGVPYKTDVDLGAQLGDIGLYGEATLRPFAGLSLKAGARSDWFFYDVLDRCAVQSVSRPSEANPPGDSSCLDQQRFGVHREPSQRSTTAGSRVMPRATLSIGPFQHFSYSLSYGTGVRSIDPAYISQDAGTPFASIRSVDGGVAYAHELGSLSLAARSVFFWTHVDRDLIFSETEGRNVLGGGTTRTGWNGLVRLRGAFFDENANISLVKSRFDDTGLLVPYAPDLVVRSDTALFTDLPVRFRQTPVRGSLSFGAGYVGHRALPYGQQSDTIFTVDANAGARWREFELGLDVTNLFDARYRAAEFNYVSDFRSQPLPTLVPARHFAAGAPRQVFLSFAITLGGEP